MRPSRFQQSLRLFFSLSVPGGIVPTAHAESRAIAAPQAYLFSQQALSTRLLTNMPGGEKEAGRRIHRLLQRAALPPRAGNGAMGDKDFDDATDARAVLGPKFDAVNHPERFENSEWRGRIFRQAAIYLGNYEQKPQRMSGDNRVSHAIRTTFRPGSGRTFPQELIAYFSDPKLKAYFIPSPEGSGLFVIPAVEKNKARYAAALHGFGGAWFGPRPSIYFAVNQRSDGDWNSEFTLEVSALNAIHEAVHLYIRHHYPGQFDNDEIDAFATEFIRAVQPSSVDADADFRLARERAELGLWHSNARTNRDNERVKSFLALVARGNPYDSSNKLEDALDVFNRHRHVALIVLTNLLEKVKANKSPIKNPLDYGISLLPPEIRGQLGMNAQWDMYSIPTLRALLDSLVQFPYYSPQDDIPSAEIELAVTRALEEFPHVRFPSSLEQLIRNKRIQRVAEIVRIIDFESDDIRDTKVSRLDLFMHAAEWALQNFDVSKNDPVQCIATEVSLGRQFYCNASTLQAILRALLPPIQLSQQGRLSDREADLVKNYLQQALARHSKIRQMAFDYIALDRRAAYAKIWLMNRPKFPPLGVQRIPFRNLSFVNQQQRVSFSRDGQVAVVASEPANNVTRLDLIDIEAQQRIATRDLPFKSFNPPEISPNGWLVHQDSQFNEHHFVSFQENSLPMIATKQEVYFHMTFSPIRNQMAWTDREGNIYLAEWTNRTQLPRVLHTWPAKSGGPIRALAFGNAGDTLFSADEPGRISRWDIRMPTDPRAMNPLIAKSNVNFYRLAISRDGQTVAAISDKNLIEIWRYNALYSIYWQEAEFESGSSSNLRRFSDITLSPDGSWLALVSDNGSLYQWDIRFIDAPCEVGVVILPENAQTVSYAPDGRLLAGTDEAAYVFPPGFLFPAN
jgi:hypothetical protein